MTEIMNGTQAAMTEIMNGTQVAMTRTINEKLKIFY